MLQTLELPANPKTWQLIQGWVMPTLLYLLPDNLLPPDLPKDRPGADSGQGMPMTVPLITARETIPFTENLQRFIYALNQGLPPESFSAIIDTWNTGSKVRDSRNFITGENPDAELPKYFCHLTFGGNTVMAKGKAFSWGGGMGIPSGTQVYELMSVDVNSLPHPLELQWYKKIHLTIYRNGQVNPFPQNGGRSGKPCYTALLSAAPLYIEARRVRVVDTPPNPYNPEFTI